MSECARLVELASAGVSPALRAVDCVAGEMTVDAFNRLFGAESAMAPVLTILLTLYIAFFAISLLTGRSSLGISALTPRMLTLGLVLTFATSWAAYQGVVWNLTVGAPDWIGSLLTGSDGSATQIFADRIDIVFAAIGEAAQNAGGQVQGSAAGGAAASMFQPADVMWLGAMLLLLGTVGILLTARIALAVLLALGPIFVVLALFKGTRGLTAGWLRGLALTGLTPLFVVLAGGITLELLVPVIAGMNQSFDGVSARAAMALFLIAAVHVALMAMVLKVAATMVGGWQVFGLAGENDDRALNDTPQGTANGAGLTYPPMQPASSSGSRVPAAAQFGADGAAHPGAGGHAGGNSSTAERRTVITQISGAAEAFSARSNNPARSNNRAHGIGSRFRSASNDAGRASAREMMK
ncbi:MAG: type IV secretion system protein [Sphingomonadaceae bacterium]|nr:type IV secretion system protein [Sphingomonadaceae bacterium]